MCNNLNNRQQKNLREHLWCQFSCRLFLFFCGIRDVVELWVLILWCINHSVMECQGKNSQKASHTAASGTALPSSSLEFQVLRQEMTVKVYQVNISSASVTEWWERSAMLKSKVFKNRTAQPTKWYWKEAAEEYVKAKDLKRKSRHGRMGLERQQTFMGMQLLC